MTRKDPAVPSEEITTPVEGGYLALNRSPEEIEAIVADNLSGQEFSEFDLTQLKVPAGGATAWEVETLEGMRSVREISGIIVHKRQTRAWWPYELGDAPSSPPSCSSADAVVGYGKQWATAEDPNPDGEPRSQQCQSCPHAAWGSGRNGGQACAAKSQWFLLTPGEFLPCVVVLPAMSLTPAKKYLGRLASAGIRFSDVTTKLHLERETKGANIFAKVIPELAARLSPEEAQRARAYGELLQPLFERVTVEPVVTEG